MSQAESQDLAHQAQRCRDAGAWGEAAQFYAQAAALSPGDVTLWHNLALARYVLSDRAGAITAGERAVRCDGDMWQAHALLARIARESGRPVDAARHWQAVLARDPDSAPALMGQAELQLNAFGDAATAAVLAARVAGRPGWQADSELTTLMAALYTGSIAPVPLSRSLMAFARSNLQRATLPSPPTRSRGSERKRVGILSPLLSASPVFFLTISTWTAVAQAHDLVIFQRGSRNDWATDRFRGIAAEWYEVAHLDAEPLAERLAAAELDVVFDLGGWSDVTGLSALSTRPALRAYTWVGGQSATTGLDAFDGWIGDVWQSPPDAQPLYAEPLLSIRGGYVDYTPPSAIARLRDAPKSGVALVGNPVKITPAIAGGWPVDVRAVTLIDRRYVHAATLDRARSVLEAIGVSVVEVLTPEGHDAYLEALSRHAAIVNTVPYAAGLTAVEAFALGVKVLGAASGGPLFAQRHLLSHARTRGRNPTLPAQILRLIAQPDLSA